MFPTKAKELGGQFQIIGRIRQDQIIGFAISGKEFQGILFDTGPGILRCFDAFQVLPRQLDRPGMLVHKRDMFGIAR